MKRNPCNLWLKNKQNTNMKNNLFELKENRVLHEFAKRLNVTPMQIIEKNKHAYISDIRHLYCKLRYDMHGVNYSVIGREIGRTHTAVRYGAQRIDILLLVNDKRTVEMWNKVKDISGYIFLIAYNKKLIQI